MDRHVDWEDGRGYLARIGDWCDCRENLENRLMRNQYFLAGLVLLFLGIECRVIESITLTPEFTQFLAERTGHPWAAVQATASSVAPAARPIVRKTFQPPEWIGWSLISMGAVLVLHSLAMRPPE